MPECSDDEDDDSFIGRVIYKKQKSPQDIDTHLKADEENLVHFLALAKYYGVSSYLLKMPESSQTVKDDKFVV